jgi:hypothetical protein
MVVVGKVGVGDPVADQPAAQLRKARAALALPRSTRTRSPASRGMTLTSTASAAGSTWWSRSTSRASQV